MRENGLKLLAIVALVYDFLLMSLRNWSCWIPLFLRYWCHRTGNRYRNASIPISRLRIAISYALCTACCSYQSSVCSCLNPHKHCLLGFKHVILFTFDYFFLFFIVNGMQRSTGQQLTPSSMIIGQHPLAGQVWLVAVNV
jgi:hypothetical protein